uniref:Uncharacterized protein n=1 Tax=Glossina brevipalpis TaxID=37001 RepID=A0A1A9WAA8_9MUSC
MPRYVAHSQQPSTMRKFLNEPDCKVLACTRSNVKFHHQLSQPTGASTLAVKVHMNFNITYETLVITGVSHERDFGGPFSVICSLLHLRTFTKYTINGLAMTLVVSLPFWFMVIVMTVSFTDISQICEDENVHNAYILPTKLVRVNSNSTQLVCLILEIRFKTNTNSFEEIAKISLASEKLKTNRDVKL